VATSKVYVNPETPLTWKNTGGTAVITGTSLANNAGRVGAQIDRGASARAQRFYWEFECHVASGTLGQTVSIYLATAHANSASPDGNVGTADAGLATLDKRRNLLFLGVVEVDVSSTALLKGSGTIEIAARYLSLVIVNESGVAFSGTATDTVFSLTPIPDENQ
jgi:hypothetical protein